MTYDVYGLIRLGGEDIEVRVDYAGPRLPCIASRERDLASFWPTVQALVQEAIDAEGAA